MNEAAEKSGTSVDEAIEFADEWAKCMAVFKGQKGWRLVCAILA